MPSSKFLRTLALAPALLLLSGCNMVLMSPSGDIALQQRDLILWSTGLMLLVIVPVIALTLIFAYKYRASNTEAEYRPDWDHSTLLELVIWSCPLLIIIALGALTWVSTHKLDPYRPLDRISAEQAVEDGVEPLVIEVVALDWKWLFLYPEQGIATVNELAAPVDRPIEFKLTSSTVMNSFFVPALAGQIYTMAGMQTRLHAVINRPGSFEGFSGNYSGEGFTWMRFEFLGMDDADFDQWVQDARTATGETLTREAYLRLEQPSEREPVRHYASVAPGLYEAILNRCVEPGRMCMNEMMAIDRQGGLGIPGLDNVASLNETVLARLGIPANGRTNAYVGGMCTADDFAFLPPVEQTETL